MVTARAGRPILLLLVSALFMLGVLLPSPAVAAEHPDGGPAAAQSVVNVVPPIREVGRPAADPSLLAVHGPTELFTLAPNARPLPALARLGEQDADVSLVSRAAVLPVAGDRAPPAPADD